MGPGVFAPVNHRCQVFQVDLVHDPRARWHDAIVLERLLGPAEQGVALPVAFVLAGDVLLEGMAGTEEVHLHRVVDDQVGRDERVDPCGIAPHGPDPVPHGGQVHDRGDSGEVLQHHPRWHEGEVRTRVDGAPRRDGRDVVLRHMTVTCVAQHVLEENADGEGKAVELYETLFLQACEAIEGCCAFGQVDGGEGAEWIGRTGHARYVSWSGFNYRGRWSKIVAVRSRVRGSHAGRGGGTGRREGLKNLCPCGREGSSPSLGIDGGDAGERGWRPVRAGAASVACNWVAGHGHVRTGPKRGWAGGARVVQAGCGLSFK